MEDHTFEVFYKGFCAHWKRQGWPTPDRSAIEGWEAFKADLVKGMEDIEKEERKIQCQTRSKPESKSESPSTASKARPSGSRRSRPMSPRSP